jgi:hypothetical protein
MRLIRNLVLLLFLGLAACSDKAMVDDGEVVANAVIANSVYVEHEGMGRVMGAMLYRVGVRNSDTGVMELSNTAPTAVPEGPVIVYIFKTILPFQREAMQREHVDVEENTAYLLRHGAKFEMDEFRKMKKIGRIDPSLGDAELAALFGVQVRLVVH